MSAGGNLSSILVAIDGSINSVRTDDVVVEAYRGGKFEKNFWTWLNKEMAKLGREAMMGKPQVIMPQAAKQPLFYFLIIQIIHGNF